MITDLTGVMDGSRVGQGKGPVSITANPQRSLIFTANWNSRSVSYLDVSKQIELGNEPTGCHTNWVGFLSSPASILYTCHYKDAICKLDFKGNKAKIECIKLDPLFPDRPSKLSASILGALVEERDKLLVVIGWDIDACVERWVLTLVDMTQNPPSIKMKSNQFGTVAALQSPLEIIRDPLSKEIFVAMPASAHVYRFDKEFNMIQNTVIEGWPSSLAIDQKRRKLFVACEMEGSVKALDLNSMNELNKRNVGNGPSDLLLLPDSDVLLVALRYDDAVVALNPDNLKPLWKIDTPAHPWKMIDALKGDVIWIAAAAKGKTAVPLNLGDRVDLTQSIQ